LFADEMGLGKTVQAAAAIRTLFREAAISRVLVICPFSLCRNWKRELQRWAYGIPSVLYEGADRYGMLSGNAKILIGSIETVANDLIRPTKQGRVFYDIGVDLLLIDEAHRIKDPDALKSRIFSSILAARRWALTGTPVENRPLELASILRFLFPNELHDVSSLNDNQLVLSLRDQSLLRRTKAQVGLELPAKTVADIPVALSPSQSAEYSTTLLRINEALGSAGNLKMAKACLLEGIQALRRIAVISDADESSKIDLLEEEVTELTDQGQKVVIFSTFAKLVLPIVRDRLDRFGAVSFTGDMVAEERERAHRSFIEDANTRVMCASLRAAGVGLTWTVASYVYHLDMWWNPQAMTQAEDRVHRIGQTQHVLVKRLVSEDTIEEGIGALQQAKSELFDLLICGSSGELRSETDFGVLLSLIGLKSTPRLERLSAGVSLVGRLD
jgi:SNF2 family DNA or RNA helicase